MRNYAAETAAVIQVARRNEMIAAFVAYTVIFGAISGFVLLTLWTTQ